MAELVSKIYGEALFEIALEEHKMELLQKETEGILTVLRDNPELHKLLSHPGIPKREKIQLLNTVFKGRISSQMLGFLTVLIEKERYKEWENILLYFINKVKEEKRIGMAYITTAVPLSTSQQDKVYKKLLETTSYETLEMNYQVDWDIIGGMIIRINDRVIDSSIRTKLKDLTKKLLQIQLG